MTRPVPQAIMFAVSLLGFAPTSAATAGATAGAEAVAKPKPPRLDVYGDPLPEGAVARLGTLRFVHLGTIAAVAISPDGKVVASGVTDGKEVYLSKKFLQQGDGITVYTGDRVTQSTIRLWDADTGKLIREIVTPDAPVSSLYFGPASRTLFAGCGRYLCSWEVSTGKQLWRQEAVKGGRFDGGVCAEKILLAKDTLISLHNGALECQQRSEQSVFSFSHRQNVVRFWDRKTGRPLLTPPALESTVRAEALIPILFHAAALSPDGRYAAVLTSQAERSPSKQESGLPRFGGNWTYTDRRLQVIDLATAKVSHTFPDVQGAIKHLVFSADGRTLAVAAGKEIRLIRAKDGKTRMLAKNLPWDYQLAFVSQQKQLAALLGEDTIRVWDVATGKRIEPHTIRKRSFWMANNGRVGVTDYGNTVRLAEIHSEKVMHAFAGHRLTPLVRFAVQSRNTLISREANKGYVWDSRSWKIKDVLVTPPSLFPFHIFGLPESVDVDASLERSVYIKECDERLELRDLRSHRLLRVMEGGAGERGRFPVFSATGDVLVTHTDKCFHFFDVGTGKILSRLPATDRLSSFNRRTRLSPRGHYFAKQLEKDWVEVFQVNPGKVLRNLSPKPEAKKGENGRLLRLDFSGDEQVLLGEFHETVSHPAGFCEQRIAVLLWNVSAGQPIQEIVIRPQVLEFWRKAGTQSQVSGPR